MGHQNWICVISKAFLLLLLTSFQVTLPYSACCWLKDTSRQQNINGAGMDRPAHPTHFKLLKKTQKPFSKESLWQGLKSVLSMWLRQTEWSLVTVLIVTPVQTVNSAQESLKASLSGERGFCKCQMTWQKVKKTLNILHCAACKFRTKTPRNLLAAGLGTNYFLCWKLLKPNPVFPHSITKISSLVIPWVPLFQKSVTNAKALPLTSFLGWEGGISLALMDGFGTKFGDYPWTLSQPVPSPAPAPGL